MQKQKTGRSKKSARFEKSDLLIMGGALIVIAVLLAFSGAQKQQKLAELGNKSIDFQALANEVVPPEGINTGAKWGCVGKALVDKGTIDIEKFTNLYRNGGRPLSEKQLEILTKCTDQKLEINAENSHFVLNVLWALGLSNKNQLLEKIANEADFDIAYLASTGGWTLGNISGGELWGKHEIMKLTGAQQKIVEDVALNTYRPCCNNPTAFPDCNHGAAALGLIELMASQGFSEKEIFEALKGFNSFWFPQQYYENAIYFKLAEGKDWNEVDAKTVLGADYSSYSGWAKVDEYLRKQGLLQQIESSGGSCGV